MISFIKNLAIETGKILLEYFSRQIEIHHKGQIDLVTEVDLLAEKFIKEQIANRYPSHSILAEESGLVEKKSEYCWIIDPIDGTTNYAHGYPFFCVSIALEYKGSIILGAIYDPIKNELFAAEYNKGAVLNEKTLNVSRVSLLDKALLVTGFPYNIRTSSRKNLDYFSKFLTTAQAVRRDGSAALDLCYVAAGRFDGFWEFNLAPWDIAAGSLIVREAGGCLTKFNGSPFDYHGQEVVASNNLIHSSMLEVLASEA